MADQDLITAEDMDAMTPDERAEAVRRGTVTSWDDVPPGFRAKVEATAQRFAVDLAAGRLEV